MKKAQLPSIFSISEGERCLTSPSAALGFQHDNYYFHSDILAHFHIFWPVTRCPSRRPLSAFGSSTLNHVIADLLRSPDLSVSKLCSIWCKGETDWQCQQSARICSVFLFCRNWISSFFTYRALHCIALRCSIFQQKEKDAISTNCWYRISFFFLIKSLILYLFSCVNDLETHFVLVYLILFIWFLFCHVCLLKHLNLFSVAGRRERIWAHTVCTI